MSAPARFILVASFGVPLLRDGHPAPLSDEAQRKKEEEGREGRECESKLEPVQGESVVQEDDGGGIGEWVLEDENGEEGDEEDELSEEDYRRLQEAQENEWKEIAKDLKQPVELHELTFAEPLSSKKAAEVLRGIQRIYAKIRMLNLDVRRTHSDGGGTVVLIPGEGEQEDRFHVAPVMYREVKDQIEFEAEQILDEPPPPAPARRIKGESYTLEQSEKCAERLLKKEGLISRDAVDALLERFEKGRIWIDEGVPGISTESEEKGEQSWMPLYEDEDLGSGGVGKNFEVPEAPEVVPNAWGADPAQPLQTVSVSHAEVLQSLENWKGAIGDELSNVFDVHQAMRKRTADELQALRDAGAHIEVLPAKALFHRKGGTGRHKCRVVACGNFSENAKASGRERKLQCYAGGADSLSLRCHLRLAGHRAISHKWRTSIADIRTAFLLAPLREKTKRTFLKPPAVLKQAGFAAEGEFWEITGALYGMQESPADWASYRDETLPMIEVWHQGKLHHLERSKFEPNMWLLRCSETSELLAVLSIYVDDLLLSGTAEASEAIWAAIKAKWRISEPEYADLGKSVTFCGFEIQQKGDGLHVGQSKYVQSLLDKYPEIQGTTMCPYAKENEIIETKPNASLEKLRRAQALVGEMLWLATRLSLNLNKENQGADAEDEDEDDVFDRPGSPSDDTSRRKQVRGAGSSGAEDWRELAEQSSGNEAAADADGDVQEDADAELQTAMFARQASTYRPVIYPGWHFSAPPSAAWDPEPAWGGPEGNFHQRIPPRIRRQDFWFHDLRRRVVVRFHAKPRRKMFLPGPAGWPDGVAQHQLTGRRRTLAKLQSPEGHEILEDDWTTAEKPTKMMARQWTGRTEFELR
ncbi:Copia protein [Symbiodinium microadriaticum]|uniref:Copia protein n=1 Tax=Symbiodinium microadriaticum TaxID=2951 RepID=A0A1Q9CBP9_SYMMI|nr:Copia protein [Symbiodinium microadriaticum]